MPAQNDHPDPMDPEHFRGLAHAAVDFIADYWRTLRENPGSLPVRSGVAPGAVAAQLPAHPPMRGELFGTDASGFAAVREDLERIILPGLTHWQHPHFYAFFPANISTPAVVGELLCAGLGVQGMLWATSPACTELETRVVDWLGSAIGLPASFLSASGTGGGVIQGTASEATLAALCAARYRVRRAWERSLPDDARAEGFFPTIYASEQAHSSVVKAAMVAGLARDGEDATHLRLIATDAQHRMDAHALARALEEDLAHGRQPCMVVASIGTTGVTAIDPLAEVARVVRERDAHAWIHVDAAHAGAACICPEFQGWLAGVERADSLCMNPHKWLLTNFDCDCFWTSDRESLVRAMSVTPEYLRNTASEHGGVIDYRDWHVPLGRRMRAMKLWLVMRAFGVEGLRAYVREHIRLAALLEELARGDARVVVAAPRTMNLLCLACAPRAGETRDATNARTRGWLERVNASGRAYVTHFVLPEATGGRYVLRVCVGATLTGEAHVRELWQLLVRSLEG